MNKKRYHTSSTTIQNKLFVLGGYNDDDFYLKSIELYDLDSNDNKDNNKNNKWNNLSNMKYGVGRNGIKYFQQKNQIIIIGGDCENDNNKLFMIYDIYKNECIAYPNTLYDHSLKPGIVIEIITIFMLLVIMDVIIKYVV